MRRWSLLWLVAALLASCRGGAARASRASWVRRPTGPPLAPGRLADRAAEALAFINDGTGVIADLFAPSFLAQVSEAQLRELTEEQLRPLGPFTVAGARKQTATSAELVVYGSLVMTMTIAIDRSPPNQITGLLLRPAPTDVQSWDDLDDKLREAAPKVALLVAEVVDGRCRAVHAVDADRVQPLGSAFKLYVLGALGRAIQTGDVAWGDQVEVRDDLRVHSSAKYGDVPAGTKETVQNLASAMISVSDNTATDLVMLHVGRDAIESSLGDLGMHDSERNIPFVTTRELSLLKWGVPKKERDEYIAADTSKRRTLLDALPKHGATTAELTDVSASPAEIDSLEWFASPEDLCRVHAALHDLGAKNGLGPVRTILSVNPGFPLGDEWTYVAFKGGSETGVMALSWLAERADGRTFVVAALLENSDGRIDDGVTGTAAAAFTLLSTQ